ncbi:MAG: hypothetical protein ACPLZ9_04120, partial [Candidatus Ratteibacteria bacterium]
IKIISTLEGEKGEIEKKLIEIDFSSGFSKTQTQELQKQIEDINKSRGDRPYSYFVYEGKLFYIEALESKTQEIKAKELTMPPEIKAEVTQSTEVVKNIDEMQKIVDNIKTMQESPTLSQKAKKILNNYWNDIKTLKDISEVIKYELEKGKIQEQTIKNFELAFSKLKNQYEETKRKLAQEKEENRAEIEKLKEQQEMMLKRQEDIMKKLKIKKEETPSKKEEKKLPPIPVTQGGSTTEEIKKQGFKKEELDNMLLTLQPGNSISFQKAQLDQPLVKELEGLAKSVTRIYSVTVTETSGKKTTYKFKIRIESETNTITFTRSIR